jgi:hypothetical protein
MSVKAENAGMPRWAAWLVVLFGVVTVAHLWTHATAPPGHAFQLGALVAGSCPEYPAHDHHDESAHPAVFMLPGWDFGITAQGVTTPITFGVVDEPAVVAPPKASSRAPPADHRGRAVLTHTLERCRR